MTQPVNAIEIRPPAPGATPAEHFRAIVLIAIVVGIIGWWDGGRGDLLNSLETGYALSTHEMARDGDWLVPQLNERPRLNKPPLPFWIGAAAGKLIDGDGASMPTLRAVATLFGALSAIFVYLLGVRMFDYRAGLWSGLIWATMYLPVYEYRFARHDIFLTAFCGMAMWGIWKAWQRERFGWAIAGTGMILAFQCKGPVSWLLTAVPAVLYALLDGYRNRPIRWKFIANIVGWAIVAGALLLPWLIAVQVHLKGDEWDRFFSEGFARVYEDDRPSNTVFFYLLIFAFALPWTAYFIGGLVIPWEERFAHRAKAMRFAWVWLVAGLVLMTFPRERETRYIVPLAAPVALLAGVLLSFHLDLYKRKLHDPKGTLIWLGHLSTMIAIVVAVPIVFYVQETISLNGMLISIGVPLVPLLIAAWMMRRGNIPALALASVISTIGFHCFWQANQAKDPTANEPLRGKAAEVVAAIGEHPIISWPNRPPNPLIYYMDRSAPTITETYFRPEELTDADAQEVLAWWLTDEGPQVAFVIVPGGQAAEQLTEIAAESGYAARLALNLTTRKPRSADRFHDPLLLFELKR